MVWAIREAQTGSPSISRYFSDFPQEAATTDPSSRYAIHPWELELALNELFYPSERHIKPRHKDRILNGRSFRALTEIIRYVRKLDDAEFLYQKSNVNILTEMHRIGHRQFEWQRGFYNAIQYYRSAFIYSGDAAQRHFLSKNGISINLISFVGTGLHQAFSERASLPESYDFSAVGVSAEEFRAAINILAMTTAEAHEHAKLLRNKPWASAYQPSILRNHPLIKIEDRIFCPLRELIASRITKGLYYDIVDGGDLVTNEIGSLFEQYAWELIKNSLPNLKVRPQEKYKKQKNLVSSVDIIIEDEHEVALAIECKSKK